MVSRCRENRRPFPWHKPWGVQTCTILYALAQHTYSSYARKRMHPQTCAHEVAAQWCKGGTPQGAVAPILPASLKELPLIRKSAAESCLIVLNHLAARKSSQECELMPHSPAPELQPGQVHVVNVYQSIGPVYRGGGGGGGGVGIRNLFPIGFGAEGGGPPPLQTQKKKMYLLVTMRSCSGDVVALCFGSFLNVSELHVGSFWASERRPRGRENPA